MDHISPHSLKKYKKRRRENTVHVERIVIKLEPVEDEGTHTFFSGPFTLGGLLAASPTTPTIPAPSHPPSHPVMRSWEEASKEDWDMDTRPKFIYRYGTAPRTIPAGMRVEIPSAVARLFPSAAAIRDMDLCRKNYELVMHRMFYRKPKQERMVYVRMIKKPGSFLNLYFPRFGEVILPVLEVPSTYTVWVRLEVSHKVIRVPLDHFRVVDVRTGKEVM